jgi:hypothetical protein
MREKRLAFVGEMKLKIAFHIRAIGGNFSSSVPVPYVRNYYLQVHSRNYCSALKEYTSIQGGGK